MDDAVLIVLLLVFYFGDTVPSKTSLVCGHMCIVQRSKPARIFASEGGWAMKRNLPSSGGAPAPKKMASGGGSAHWSMRLLESMSDPAMVVKSDVLTVTVKDAYPKARHHYLVLPKENISNLKSLIVPT